MEEVKIKDIKNLSKNTKKIGTLFLPYGEMYREKANIGLHIELSEIVDSILCSGETLKEVYETSDIIACYLFGSSVAGPKQIIKKEPYKTFSFRKFRFVEKIRTITTYPQVNDIDVIVIVNKLKGRENIKEERTWDILFSWTDHYDSGYRLNKEKGLLDILYIDKETLNSSCDKNDTVRKNCEKEGVLLFGEDVMKTNRKVIWKKRTNNRTIIDCEVPNYPKFSE